MNMGKRRANRRVSTLPIDERGFILIGSQPQMEN
jgi:hypothetical protein